MVTDTWSAARVHALGVVARAKGMAQIAGQPACLVSSCIVPSVGLVGAVSDLENHAGRDAGIGLGPDGESPRLKVRKYSLQVTDI